MTPSQLPGYLGREIPEGLPLLFTSTVFLAFLSFLSTEEEDLWHNCPHPPPSLPPSLPSTSLKTWLFGLIMIKVTADRALRGNINHAHCDILMDLETNRGIPSHFTFLSPPCIQMSRLTMNHPEKTNDSELRYTFFQMRAWVTVHYGGSRTQATVHL